MFGPLSNTIQGVVNSTWPMIIISTIVIVSLRVSYIFKYHKKVVLYKELLMLSFIIYVLCLFQVVTFQDAVNWSSNNFIPFREIFRYDFGSRLFLKNVVGNVLMFMPFGFFASYYLENKKPWLTILLTIIASFSIELVQMVIGRVFDVDDIMLNIVGGALGYFCYFLLVKISKRLPNVLKSELFLNIVAIILLVGLLTLL